MKIHRRWRLAILSYILHIVESSFVMFEKNLNLDNHICVNDTQVFATDGTCRTQEQCLYACKKTPSCFGVFYDDRNNICRGCSAEMDKGLQADGLLPSGATRFYFKKTRRHGEACISDTPCDSNLQCSSAGVCSCRPGYSFDYNLNTCLESCVAYGETYEVHPGKYITGFNIEELHNVTQETCEEHCNTEPLCRTFDTGSKDLICYLQHATVLSNPEAYYTNAYFVHHHRNCAYNNSLFFK